MRHLFALVLAACLMAAEIAPAAEPTPPARAEQPVRITSDRLEAFDAERRMRFIGDVVARQGELVIYARELEIFYDEKRQIDRIEVAGDVRMVQAARVATGDRGVYHRQEGKVVLTGSARVHQGESFVEGDEIIVFLDENRSIVSSRGGSRVNAVFSPGSEEQ